MDKAAAKDELLGETNPVDGGNAGTQVWVNATGDPIELISACETISYSLSEARELHDLLGRAIERVAKRTVTQ